MLLNTPTFVHIQKLGMLVNDVVGLPGYAIATSELPTCSLLLDPSPSEAMRLPVLSISVAGLSVNGSGASVGRLVEIPPDVPRSDNQKPAWIWKRMEQQAKCLTGTL